MLLEYSVKNFKSIKDEITLSMVASVDSSFNDKLINSFGYKVLRTNAIYGANGSGKSNIIKSLSFMKAMVSNSINHQLGDKIRYNPHKLSIGEPTILKMQFVIDGIRYAYGFSLTDEEIIDEYLYFFPEGGRQNKVFERSRDVIQNNIKYEKQLAVSKDILLSNRLFLSCCANYSSIVEVKKAFLYIKEQIIIYSNDGPTNWLNYSIKAMQDNPQVKASYCFRN